MHTTVVTYDRLDCAFNNAGTGGGGLLHECSEEEWYRIVAVNLTGVWRGTKYQIAQMRTPGGGANRRDPQPRLRGQ